MTTNAADWTVLVPVKRLSAAKSRFAVDASTDRARLAVAFACDVVAAASHCSEVTRVLVVASDDSVFEEVGRFGADRFLEPATAGSGVGALNAALGAAAMTIAGPVAAVAGDLPALTSEDLTAVLAAASAVERGFVSDRAGVGTTILCSRTGVRLDPHFGPASTRAHRESGATDLTAAAPASSRLDVDTIEDLLAAFELGVGAQTEALRATTVTVTALNRPGHID